MKWSIKRIIAEHERGQALVETALLGTLGYVMLVSSIYVLLVLSFVVFPINIALSDITAAITIGDTGTVPTIPTEQNPYVCDQTLNNEPPCMPAIVDYEIKCLDANYNIQISENAYIVERGKKCVSDVVVDMDFMRFNIRLAGEIVPVNSIYK